MSSDDKQRPFATRLDAILEDAGVSLPALAKDADVSRTHLESIKRGDSIPSGSLLRKLSTALLNCEAVRPRDVIGLLIDAIAGDQDRLTRILPGVPEHILDHRSTTAGTRGILTDVLAECLYEKVLLETLDEMEHSNTEYLYFLPKASQDWESLYVKIKRDHPSHLARFRKQALCVLCPDYLVYSRMRIDRFFSADPSVYISLGRRTDPVLFPVENEVVRNLLGLLKAIAEKARLTRQTNETYIRHQGMEFERVDWNRADGAPSERNSNAADSGAG